MADWQSDSVAAEALYRVFSVRGDVMLKERDVVTGLPFSHRGMVEVVSKEVVAWVTEPMVETR